MRKEKSTEVNQENATNESIKIKKLKIKLIKWGILFAVIIAIGVGIFVKGYTNASEKFKDTIAELEKEVDRLSEPIAVYEEASQEVSLSLIYSKISDIGELATIEYLYTDAGKFEDPKQLFGKNIPFTTKSFIAKWDGIIKAGIKIEDIIIEINDADKEIIVHMPEATILSHEIDEESIETLDEKNGLFNEVTVDDVRNFDQVSKDAMEKRAIENGLLDRAIKNAEKIIERLVNNDIVKEQEYRITFTPIAK